MRTKDLIHAVAAVTELPRREVRETVLVALDIIADALADGEPMTLRGVGTLSVKPRGASLVMPSGNRLSCSLRGPRVVRFSPTPALEKELNVRPGEVL